MKYRILKIKKVSDNHYDVDFKEARLVFPEKTYRKVRVEFSSILARVVSTGKYLHNFEEVLEAYDCSDVDFTERDEPSPIVECIFGRAIY